MCGEEWINIRRCSLRLQVSGEKKKKLGKDSQLKTKMEVSVNQKNKVSGE